MSFRLLVAMPVTPRTILHGVAMPSHAAGTSSGASLQPHGLDELPGGVPVMAAAVATATAWRFQYK